MVLRYFVLIDIITLYPYLDINTFKEELRHYNAYHIFSKTTDDISSKIALYASFFKKIFSSLKFFSPANFHFIAFNT